MLKFPTPLGASLALGIDAGPDLTQNEAKIVAHSAGEQFRRGQQ